MADSSSSHSDGASDDDLLKVIGLLNAAGARYLVIGGFAAILHQIPRFTRDVDISKDKLDIELLLEHSAEAREAMRQINELRNGPKRGCLGWFAWLSTRDEY